MGKSIKTNTILNTIKTIFSIIFPLITFPYVSRVLLPDNVGKVNWANSYVSYFTLLASLGISTYAIRTCSLYKNDRKELSRVSSEIFSINLITTIISYFVLFVSIIFFRKLDAYRYLIIISSSTIVFTTIGADYLNTVMEDFKYITIRTIAFQLIALVSMFVFVKNKEDYYKYMLICTLSSSGANVANYFYRKRYCKTHFTFKINWKSHMPPILLLFVMSLSQMIFNNVDITMLGLIWNDKEVGLYTTAHKITNIISQVIQSVILVILPRLSYYFAQEDYCNINRLLKKLLSFNIGLGLPCVVGTMMLSNDIVYIIGGADFMDASSVLRILIISFMFSLVGGSFLGNAILIPSKQEKYYMVVCWITAFCNIILNYLLIPKYAAVGAAISTAFNGFIIFILLLFKVNKNIKIEKILSVFIGPLIGCIAITICCLVCRNFNNLFLRVIFSVVSSSVLYGAILLSLKNEFAIEILDSIKRIFMLKFGGRRNDKF